MSDITHTLCVVLSLLSMQTIAIPNNLSKDIVMRINRRATTWEATPNFIPTGTLACAHLEPATKTGMVHRRFLEDPVAGNQTIVALPDEFDARTHWPECPSIGAVTNQGDCGTCWAMAAAATMTDRMCIHSNGSDHFVVSAQDLVTCCVRCRGGGDVCEGGYSSRAWMYWNIVGIVSGGPFGTQQSCRPYAFPPILEPNMTVKTRPAVMRRSEEDQNSGGGGDSKTCDRKCQEGYGSNYEEDLRYASSVYLVPSNENAIKSEIYWRGPVQAGLMVYEDLCFYKSGVYEHVTGEELGGHAVRIIGWGVENGTTPYWLVANTWGATWGDLGGVFKIVRGKNHCLIEEQVCAGLPDFGGELEL